MSLPDDIRARLKELWPHARLVPRRAARHLPAGPGSYVLVFSLPEPLTFASGRFRGRTVPAGWYAYAGSARGPGGLRGRVSRHMKKRKKRRWHIDWLTCAREEIFALGFAQETECHLAGALRQAGHVSPLPGFGSSDCKDCESHLVFLAPLSAAAGQS